MTDEPSGVPIGPSVTDPSQPLPTTLPASFTVPLAVTPETLDPETAPENPADPGAVIDYKHAASIAVLEYTTVQQQDQINQLTAANAQLLALNAKLAVQTSRALMAMPCPNGYRVGVPPEYIGDPANYPGSTPATVEQCMADGHCNCDVGAAINVPPASPEG